MGTVDALVYSSQADPALSDAELELLLIKARYFNAARGITGVLLKTDHTILQYIEGEGAALERTFTEIARSPLHSSVTILTRAHGVTRHFDRWHMGFHTFQRRHERGEAHRVWLDALPEATRAAQTNPALATLLSAWRNRGGPPVPTLATVDRD